ncbi:hypothetical protein HNY73_015244 [Argiope bruennichi]|uniref:MADF domain-containing protein n=1 Tax=Argiope bruennichi TaxID=94029 RepID=A0A8T0ERS8_ARGBR|nr:hypothetical protein HNY73_015244 [Argiope bruennichi]
MKWSDNETCQFVSLLREHECLWKLDSAEYKNKAMKSKAIAVLKEAQETTDSMSENQDALDTESILGSSVPQMPRGQLQNDRKNAELLAAAKCLDTIAGMGIGSPEDEFDAFGRSIALVLKNLKPELAYWRTIHY